MSRPYRATSLSGAQAQVRRLRRQLRECHALLAKYDAHRRLMARLAADTPQFSNPIVIWEAKKLRDSLIELPGLKSG